MKKLKTTQQENKDLLKMLLFYREINRKLKNYAQN